MLNVSNAFNEAFKSPTRQVLVRVTMKNVVYTNNDVFNVEYTGGSITGETFNIGSVFSNSIKITFTKVIEAIKQLDKIKLEFGIVLADGSREFVSMGYFFVDKYNPDRNANRTVIEALDQMTQLERVYKSKLTYPARIKDVALEIANLSGSVVDQASFERLSTSAIIKFEGKTYRQAIGLIAQFGGGFAIFDRDGKLSIRTLSDPNFSISTAEYFSRGLVKNETMYTLGGISCKVSTKNGDTTTDFMLQSGSPLGNQIVLENSSMTQILLDGIYQQLKNTNYYPYTLSWRGNPALEAGDWISMSDTKDNSFKMPNLTYKLSFSGGLKATSSADTSSVSQASASYRGPINQQLIELQGWKSAAGGWTYTGTTEPSTPKEGDVWFKPNGPDSETWIYEGGKWVFQTSTAGIRQVTEEMNQAQKDIVEAKKAADDAVDKANANVQAIEANAQLITDVNAIANTAKSQAQTADTNAQTALTSANTAITNANKAISDAGKLSEDVLALDAIANQAKSDADTALINANKGITDAKTALDKAIGVDTRVTTKITNVNNTVATKANSTTVDALSKTVSSQGTAISQNATDIKLKADSTVVNAIKGTVDSQGTLISQNSKDIALKANKSSVDTLTGRVSANETAIDITAQGVSTLVTKTDNTNTSLSQFKQDYEGFKSTVYTKGQTDTKVSTVQQSVDNFKTTVSNTHYSKSETDSKVTAVQSNVDKIGNYTAYANSADGADGFTTVYPNLNLLDGTKDFKPYGAGTNTPNQNAGEIYFTQNKKVADLFKAGDYITISYDIEFLNTDLYSSSDSTIAQIQMYGGGWTWLSRVAAKNIDGKFYTKDTFKSSGYVENPTHKVTVSRTIQLTQDFITANATVNRVHLLYNYIPVGADTNLTNLKIEPAKDLNSTATPWMPSEKELTSNDIPKYVGYSARQSENPKDFSWQPYGGLNSYKIIEATTSIDQNADNIALKANKSEVDTLSGKVSTAEGSITTMAGQIKLKANQTDVDSVKGRVTSAEGSISTMAGQIALKANQADVNTITGKVNAVESSITVQSGQITALNTKTDGQTTQIGSLQSSYSGLTSTVSSVKNDLNNLTVGGENLLIDTDIGDLAKVNAPEKRYFSDAGNTIITAIGFKKVSDSTTPSGYVVEATSIGGGSGGSGRRIAFYSGSGSVPFVKGETYTMSCYARKISGNPKIPFQYGNSTDGYKTSVVDVDSANWKQYSFTFVYDLNNPSAAYLGGIGSLTAGTLQSCGFKVERGNKATSWGLSQYELATVTDLSQLSQDLSGFKTTVSNTYLSKSDASGTYADKNSVASQITQSATAVTSNVQSWTNNKLTAYSTTQQTANSITSAVASKADKSQVTQLSDQITSAVTQMNSENMNFVLDGSFQTGDNWSTTSTTSTTYTLNNSKGVPISAGSYLRMLDTKDEYFVTQSASTQVINSLKNSTVTFSMYVKCASGSSDTFRIYIRTKAADGTLTYLGRTNQTVTTSWKRLSITVEIPADVTELVFTANVRGLPNVYCYFTGAQATIGNVLLPYAESTLNLASKSQITQLSDMINLRVSKGDVTSQINLEAGRTLIDTKQLLLNANTVKFSGSAFIPDAMIKNLTASKINVGTLNGANVNIINLNASNITGGTLNAIDIKGSNITSVGENYTLNQKNGSITWNRNSDGKKVFGIETQVEPSNEGNTVFEVSKKGSLSIFSKTEDVNIYKNLLTFYNNADNGITASSSVDKIFVQGTDNSASRNQTYSLTISESGISYTSSKSTRPTFNFSNFNSAISFLVGDDISSISLIGGVARVKSKYTTISGDFTVTGSKNAIHATRDGVRATPAYETAESYLGDIGSNYTRENCEVWIEIERLFSDTVNTDIAYQVFLQAYDDAKFWVADFKSDKFLIKSDKPLSRFVWEIKAKRRGYESDRLVLQDDFDSEKIEEAWREK